MKISIITVCFNSAKTLEDTFKSVKSQTYQDIEYIVVDGGSKDETIEIIKKYEKIISSWISESDKGLYDAINKGIEKASGDFIGILNSDDVFYSNNTIQDLINFLEQQKDVDAIIGDIVQVKNNKIIRKYSSKNWTPNKLRLGFMPPHPSIFIKKSVYNKLGLYKLGYKIAADYELIIRYFLKNKINFKYSGIITTKMLVGGASSSGASSYKIITNEVQRAFNENDLNYSKFRVKYRVIWKLMDYIFKN